MRRRYCACNPQELQIEGTFAPSSKLMSSPPCVHKTRVARILKTASFLRQGSSSYDVREIKSAWTHCFLCLLWNKSFIWGWEGTIRKGIVSFHCWQVGNSVVEICRLALMRAISRYSELQWVYMYLCSIFPSSSIYIPRPKFQGPTTSLLDSWFGHIGLLHLRIQISLTPSQSHN